MTENPYTPPTESGADLPKPRKTTITKIVVTSILLLLIGAILGMCVLPAVTRHYVGGKSHHCSNNLRQIAIALQSYHDKYQSLPPAYTVDKEGRPLHSWRTLILPFIEGEQELYDSIDLSRPWDHPVNQQAFAKEVACYQCEKRGNLTTYKVVSSPEGCFYQSNCRSFSDITDSHDETIMLVEVLSDQAVPWMAPQDTDEAQLVANLKSLEKPHFGGFHIVFCSCRVYHFSNQDSDDIHAMITIAAGDRVGL